ncbi:MAG: MBL fold metallo-hydrolase [Caldilineaceae bacterium SB0661_bin_32]|uniref:MBL fold metallo-hydrolase n=1 Tax=Caldilineaceae bacterium SB0661_bin_32 TaxID=2605255 RepID=A0A6B1D418_9CHLR|nr:MBL fold metallo-hydrolase [Caldilineaceae bacterium SB0661_bin_32]
MLIAGLTVGLLQENCYILGCEESLRGVVIDPGDSARAILNEVEEMGLTIEKIINTHSHFDHVLAVNAVRAATGAPFYLHREDLPILRAAPERVREWLGARVDPIDEPDHFLQPGQVIEFGAESLEVRFTPGHSPGHVVFVDHANEQIFAGDTLFRGSIGRFDLPLADGPTLCQSIQEQLLTLPDTYVVYPGHGEATTIGAEREANPFVGRAAAFSFT